MTNENKHFIYGILMLAFLFAFIILAFYLLYKSESLYRGIDVIYNRSSLINADSEATEEVKGAFIPENAYQMEITGFSTGECRTDFCIKNATSGRDTNNDGLNDVALNAKYGKWSKIYIPTYDKYYSVIGTTDSRTDCDLWFSDQYEQAKEFGRKNLMVVLVK